MSNTNRDVAALPTELAATVAVSGEVPEIPTSLRSTRPSVLPRVKRDEAGVRLVHEPCERYVLRERLGAGGMGEALRAEDVDIGRDVAIKRLLPSAAGATGLARFVEEVHIVGALEHPNVVPLHDVGLDQDGRYFFVMKYVEGETIERIIERLAAGDAAAARENSVERRIEVFLGILHALAYAHERGIIHRDIKPSNVMIGRYGEVWLMDWGVAKRLRAPEIAGGATATQEPPVEAPVSAQLRSTRRGALVGTPAYMAPEQARGDNDAVGERADLYAACVLFHELLGLRHYLADHMTSLPDLVGAIEAVPADFSRLTQVADGQVVPAELVHFLVKGLAKDPAARWGSAREMTLEIERILTGKIRVQCMGTMTKRMTREAGRFVDRHPVMAFNLLVVSALLVLAAIATLIATLVR